MWSLYTEAKTWRCRPSDLMGLAAGTVEAWSLDSAVGAWGRAVTEALESVTGKKPEMVRAGQERVLAKWLTAPGRPSMQQFRTPTVGEKKG